MSFFTAFWKATLSKMVSFGLLFLGFLLANLL